MGCLWSSNKKLKNVNKDMNTRLKLCREVASKNNVTIIQLKKENKSLLKLKNEHKANEIMLLQKFEFVKNVLGDSNHIADSILASELNCAWLADAKEKIYLVSIIDFLYIICIKHVIDTPSDILIQLHPTLLTDSITTLSSESD